MEAILYALPECEACEKAQEALQKQGFEVRKLVMDDPIRKLGAEIIFGKVYAPFVVLKESDVYVFSKDFDQLLKVKTE